MRRGGNYARHDLDPGIVGGQPCTDTGEQCSWFFDGEESIKYAMVVLTCIGATFMSCGSAIGQSNYPNKSVRVIVPYPPGGITDVVSRTVSLELAKSLGQSFVVDNRPGANRRPRAVNRVPACGMRTSASRDARRRI